MSLDNILLIPCLSKELNLIGYKTLPFKFKNKVKIRPKRYGSDSDTETDDPEPNPVKIYFDSRKMICELVGVCMELVKQVKALSFVTSNDELDKLKFENAKLEKQLSNERKTVEKRLNELAGEKEKNRELKEKIMELEMKIKDYESESKKIVRKCKTSENVLRHNLKKQESNVKELHTLIWKQFNMVDKNYFPDNFELVQIHQPDFNKLWRDVKYTRPATKEEALKKAICIFQENNNLLMEDNQLLKNLLMVTLDEVHYSLNDIYKKLHLTENNTNMLAYEVNKLFDNVQELKVDAYKTVVEEHFSFLRDSLEIFDEVSFSVSDNLFVCWSDIIKQSQTITKKNLQRFDVN